MQRGKGRLAKRSARKWEKSALPVSQGQSFCSYKANEKHCWFTPAGNLAFSTGSAPLQPKRVLPRGFSRSGLRFLCLFVFQNHGRWSCTWPGLALNPWQSLKCQKREKEGLWQETHIHKCRARQTFRFASGRCPFAAMAVINVTLTS